MSRSPVLPTSPFSLIGAFPGQGRRQLGRALTRLLGSVARPLRLEAAQAMGS